MNFTDEALEYWNQLSEEERRGWTSDLFCQKCKAEISTDAINASVYEEQLALFHECSNCLNKEVRLIDITQLSQKAVDDDFERWAEAKRKERPDLFNK